MKPFLDLGFKKILGIEPPKICPNFQIKIKLKLLMVFRKIKLKKIKKNADLILASNVFAHSDDLKEMAKCIKTLS